MAINDLDQETRNHIIMRVSGLEYAMAVTQPELTIENPVDLPYHVLNTPMLQVAPYEPGLRKRKMEEKKVLAEKLFSDLFLGTKDHVGQDDGLECGDNLQYLASEQRAQGFTASDYQDVPEYNRKFFSNPPS